MKRFKVSTNHPLIQDENGDWVKFEDVKTVLETEIKNLENELEIKNGRPISCRLYPVALF